ncbi:hypothetical protein [Lactococcus taiwanensis]|uniref:hypothetical protein n=1 Tax=Lactococcus taiwanensis TaxID=1151742 RepID=UPI00196342D5|nr:hypothetical protein [Lactococcus taiwanensis]QRZ10517.1 hypothetical protein JVB21_06900 [Lactococcus taiwanensis]
MRKINKQHIAGALIIPGLLGSLVYGATFVSSDEDTTASSSQALKKKAVAKGNNVSLKTLSLDAANSTAKGVAVTAPVWNTPTFKTAIIPTSNTSLSMLSNETSNDASEDGYSGITPAIGLTTFKDSYSELEADEDVLHIHTKAHGNGTAALQAYRQEITIDPDIAGEFFSTNNYQKYIRGTVNRSKDSALGGTTSYDIASKLWGNSSWLGNPDTMNYDSKTGSIYYKTSQYTLQLLSGIDIEVDMYIDLGQWSKDTGKLIERKDNYSVQTKTDANSASLGLTNKIVGSIASDGIENSWIENPVEPTTLYYLTEKNSYYYGNGLQDEVNEHETDYDIELSVNGTPFKYIQMATEDGGTNSRGETIKKGDWDFDFGSYLNKGDVVTARVRGKEKYDNLNGEKPIKYSTVAHASDATNIVAWEDWKVEDPSVPILYDGDLIIPFHAPVQNQQLNRTYKLIVTVNGEEIYNKAVKDETNTNVPYLSGLEKGDIVKAKIVGSQPGETDKESSEITAEVITQDDEGYDDWEVQDPIINGPLYEGGTVITGQVPIQNRAAGRTYDLKVYLGDELIIDEENIDVALKSYPFSYALTDLDEEEQRALAYGDEIKAVVIGHQPDATDDSGKVTATYPDKTSQTTLKVSDNTGYEAWEVNQPTLDSMLDTDTIITGDIGEQNTEAGRTYKVAIWTDDEDPIYVTPAEDGTFKLEDVVLQEGEKVSATVIGSQEKREDKSSQTTTVTVTDATDYSGWKIEKPVVDELKDTDTKISGHIGNQNEEFDRSYTVEIFVNGVSKGQAQVAEDGTFAADKIILSEGDKVKAVVTGHQEGKADKSAASDEVIVSDGSNYADWTVAPATLDDVYAHADGLTGEIPAQDNTNGRTYQILVTVDGSEVTREDIEADQGSYNITLPDSVDLQEGQIVAVQIIGHQEGKEDKLSTETKVQVKEKVYTTTSSFKNGYWQYYGLVYEGQVDNEGWDLSTASCITKTAKLVNHTTGEVVTEGIKAANTNWYDSSRYNGYQIIISNEVLGGLSEGDYTIQLSVAIDGVEKDTIDLNLEQVVSYMGPMHDNYADMEQVVIKQNTVKPQVIDNKPGIVITRDVEASVQVFNKYWNNSNELVFEGYVNTTADFSGVTKKLVIKDVSGEVVATRNNIYTFSSSWGIPVDVDPTKSFQAIVPAAYTNQANYTYELVITDAQGTTFTEVLN